MRIFILVFALATASAWPGQKAAKDGQLAATKEQFARCQRYLNQHQGSAEAKKQYVVAADRYALAAMTSSELPPKVKYPLALRLYRQALRIDPRNVEASHNAALIVSIYKQMHRPIPK